MRFNKVIATIRQKYGEISGFVTFARNIYITKREYKSERVLFDQSFLREPSMV